MSDNEIIINSGGGESRRPEPLALVEPGQYIDFAVINEEKAPAYVYGTNERAMTRDGKPKTKDIVTVLVVRGTGMIGRSDNRRTVQPGDIATIHIEGQDRWDPDADKTRAKGEPKSWSGAKEDHGQLRVGDVGRWHFEGLQQGKGAQPRKIRLFRLRGHRPDEAEQTARCRDLHTSGVEINLGAGGGAGARFEDEEPF
jgi:hypothetical protein